jgi:hypothetical protein
VTYAFTVRGAQQAKAAKRISEHFVSGLGVVLHWLLWSDVVPSRVCSAGLALMLGKGEAEILPSN